MNAERSMIGLVSARKGRSYFGGSSSSSGNCKSLSSSPPSVGNWVGFWIGD